MASLDFDPYQVESVETNDQAEDIADRYAPMLQAAYMYEGSGYQDTQKFLNQFYAMKYSFIYPITFWHTLNPHGAFSCDTPLPPFVGGSYLISNLPHPSANPRTYADFCPPKLYK